MKKVQDKVIIVTGASAGIGLATAKLLAEHGARVALAARSKEVLDQLAEEIPGSFAVATDMSNETDIKEMIHKIMPARDYTARLSMWLFMIIKI
jgi:NADP-dependent 3-hydroxy acid dehydrogenase YdfG